jgi:VWFA-related protein
MLVSYDRSLHVRQEFTNQPSKINAAMFELEDVSGHGVSADSERRRVLQAVNEAQDVGDAMLQVRPYAESLFNDLSFSLSAIEEMIDSLAGLAGRKAILYVSDGLPMKAGEEMFYMVQQKFQYTPAVTQMLDFDASRIFRTIGNKANSNGVTFYSIDAAGLRVSTASSVEMAQADGGIEGMTSYIDTIYRQNIQEPLRFLADLTGGRAILNTNDIGDDLLKIKADFDSYYSLGYTPADSGEGRLHKIEVKVKGRKGLRIRHRGSYRDKSLSAQMVDGTLAALRYGFEDNPLGLLLEIGSPTPSQDGLFTVPIKVGIPLSQVVLVPRQETYYGRTRLFFGAIDDKERLSEVTNLELPIRIPADRLAEVQDMFFPYETSLLMRGGPHQLAVGLRDELGSARSYVTRSFFVGSR